MFSGLLDLPWWGYVIYALVLTHITIASVTIFLHRHQAHRALDLHPIPSHFFRCWLWLTTGMITKSWASIHRKHHAKCETKEDPHSPQVLGLRKVLWQGAELYRLEAKNKETLERYGHGTPDDWLEHHVYNHDRIGIYIMLAINLIVVGPIGITVWAVQMAWIPFFAAGIINGVGHYWGYRNFQADDASTNVLPWGILIGGEELHNNHHAYATSAKLSNRWYEFDIGWLYIRILETLGLAKVKKIAPVLKEGTAKPVDLATLQTVVTHRYEILTRYAASVRDTCGREIQQLKDKAVAVDRDAIRRWLTSTNAATLPQKDREQLEQVFQQSKVLATVCTMREELVAVWQRSTASKDDLVRQLEDWCRRAEASGIEALQEFSRRLRCYA